MLQTFKYRSTLMTSSKRVKKRSSFRPRKQFGQHWLKDERILEQIIIAAELTKNDRILEIGPGTGIFNY